MGYKISEGITESELAIWLKAAASNYGVFDDGRVNYKEAKIAPIVMCSVIYGSQILLVKRAYGLADAEGYWSTVNGFIDEIKPVKEQVKQEISEELGLTVANSQIRVGKSYTLMNPKEKKNYIVFPCLVELEAKPKIVLDHENTEFTWIKREELDKYHILNDLAYSIDSALKLQ